MDTLRLDQSRCGVPSGMERVVRIFKRRVEGRREGIVLMYTGNSRYSLMEKLPRDEGLSWLF